MPFALVFVALLGVSGLVLDVGWSYYIGKKAQNAADAAAQAAVAQALILNGPSATPSCGSLGMSIPSVMPPRRPIFWPHANTRRKMDLHLVAKVARKRLTISAGTGRISSRCPGCAG